MSLGKRNHLLNCHDLSLRETRRSISDGPNKITVFYSNIQNQLLANHWSNLLASIPFEQQAKILNFYNIIDQRRALLGRLLISYGLRYYEYPPETLAKLKISNFGRPSIDAPIDFNLSHSGEWVILAITNLGRVGVDIEKIRDVNLSMYGQVMTSPEWAMIFRSQNQKKEFFRLWVKKESLIKANGKGLSIPLNQIEIIDEQVELEGVPWFLKEFRLDSQHMGYLCCDLDNYEIDLIEAEIGLAQSV